MPNGLRTFIDNGALTSTVMGINRAANPQVNATILDNGGSLQDYSEALDRDCLVQIRQRSGRTPTASFSNAGILSEHYRFTTPDRIFQIQGNDKGVPAYNVGGNEEDLAIHFGGKRIKMKFDEDLPARSLYFLYEPGYRMHTLLEDDWFKGEDGILRIAPADGGGTFKNVWLGEMQGCFNVSHKNLNAQGAILNIRDRDSARD
jgi:hypothetical protein